MCIIIYKPEHVDVPTESIMRACWDNNPHGAGLALMRPGYDGVAINKGYMKYDDFLSFTKQVRSSDTAIYHFRIATSGGINPQACHPFPVSNKVSDLRELHCESAMAFIHNGIISDGSKELSDTQLYIRDILSKYVSKGMSANTRQQKIAQDTIGSRTALMDGYRHKVFLTGDWIHDKDTGLYFSNGHYKPAKSFYDDFDWDYLDTPKSTGNVWDDIDTMASDMVNMSYDFENAIDTMDYDALPLLQYDLQEMVDRIESIKGRLHNI